MLGHLFIFLLFILLLTLVGGDVRHVSLSSPPTVVVEYPEDNSTVTGPRLPLRLALEVERWCGADGDGDDTGADCTPLADLVICVWAGNARQQCLPLLSALQQPGALDLSTAHMPVGTFDLSVWLYASSNSSSHPSTGRHVLVRGRAPPSSEGGDATPRTPPLPPPNEVRLHRPAPWDAARAEALTQLLPIDTSIPRRGDWQRQRSEGDEHGVERESETTTRGLRLGLLRHGPLLFNVQDFPAGISLDLQGEWEESVVRLLASALRPGDLVVDVGAHLGSFTVPLAKKVGRGRVLSLEPQQDLFQALNANLALNGLFNVQALRAAASHRAPPPKHGFPVWAPRAVVFGAAQAGNYRSIPVRDPSGGASSNFGSFSLLDGDGGSGGARSDGVGGIDVELAGAMEDAMGEVGGEAPRSSNEVEGGRMTTFPIISLDEVRLLQERCPALVKVDVEGMEASVLWGARRTIDRCRPVLYVENQCLNTTTDLVTTLSGGGGGGGGGGLGSYRCFWDPAPYFAPDNYLGLKEPGAVGGGMSLNMICLPGSGESLSADENERDTVNRRVRTQWMVFRDVLDQLAEVAPHRPLVEQYNPVPLRLDAGAGPPSGAVPRTADC